MTFATVSGHQPTIQLLCTFCCGPRQATSPHAWQQSGCGAQYVCWISFFSTGHPQSTLGLERFPHSTLLQQQFQRSKANKLAQGFYLKISAASWQLASSTMELIRCKHGRASCLQSRHAHMGGTSLLRPSSTAGTGRCSESCKGIANVQYQGQVPSN